MTSLILVSSTEWNQLRSDVTRILSYVRRIDQEEKTVMTDLTQLTSDVQANTDVVNSAVTLLQGLKAALDAAGTDPAKLAALSTQLETSTAALSAAVVANTPAAPPPTT